MNSRSPASCSTAKGARFFIPIKTAQDIAGADGRVSMFYVRSKGDTEGARNELVKLLPTYKIRSMAEYSTLMTFLQLAGTKALYSVVCHAWGGHQLFGRAPYDAHDGV